MNATARRALALALAALCLAAPARAEPRLEIPYDGPQAFLGVLNKTGMKPLDDYARLWDDPAHSILIVFGDPSAPGKVPGGLGGFLANGGTALVATDRPWFRSGPERFPDVNPVVTGDLVRAPAREADAYRGLPDCPWVKPEQGEEAARLFRGPLGSDGRRQLLRRVASNRPSFLHLGRSLALVASTTSEDETPSNVAAVGQWGPGRLLVIADHSVFINAMMIRRDTDNFDFAFNCVEWLADGDPQRNRVLFVGEDGAIRKSFEVPLGVPPMPSLDALVPPINNVLAGLQNDKDRPNLFNKVLVPSAQAHRHWIMGLTALLVFGLMLYGYFWLARARYRGEVGLPPLQKAVQRRGPDQSVQQQRHRALLAAGNLWEAARLLVRQELPELTGPRPPLVRGGWWQRLKLRGQVRRLWRLAAGPGPGRVSPAEMARLPAEVRAVRRALAEGELLWKDEG